MKQSGLQKQREDQSNELWQIYMNRQQYGNEAVPKETFENRFWQHYNRLRGQITNQKQLVTVPLEEGESRHNVERDLNHIFNKYWEYTQLIPIKKGLPIQIWAPKSIIGNIVFPLLFLSISISFFLIVLQHYAMAIIPVAITIFLLFAPKRVLGKIIAKRINLILSPNLMSYQVGVYGKPFTQVDLPYKDIQYYSDESSKLTILGFHKDTTREISIPKNLVGFRTIQSFIQEVVKYNALKK